MDLEKILKRLNDLTHSKKSSLKENCEAIQELLEKLEKKRNKLNKKLPKEDSNSKRKSIKLDLKITEAEIKNTKKILRKQCK
jgi:molybdopterin converting factor small subunit